MTRHSCSTLPLESHGCAFHIVQRTNTFILLISDSHTNYIAHFIFGITKCSSLLRNKWHIMLNVYIYIYSFICARASLGRKWSIARTARSTSYDPNLIQHESGTHFMSTPDGDDEDLRRIANSQLEEVPYSPSLEDHVLQVARREPGAIHRAARGELYSELLRCQCLRC